MAFLELFAGAYDNTKLILGRRPADLQTSRSWLSTVVLTVPPAVCYNITHTWKQMVCYISIYYASLSLIFFQLRLCIFIQKGTIWSL